ncbi:hypothetical protein [Phragmitibacter flavus]|uniref:hypothetical protein n=1 Tax=Phragmitibacter flavus TaxID=2576071 RepID=UPI00197F3887|nr:hypothetical protein [Phragmitibacter flavus]
MPQCPVCGFANLKEPPRAASGGGSYEICPCCGFQFGVDDDDRGLTDEQAREAWVAKGMPWKSKSRKAPEGWDAAEQVQNFLQPKKKRPTVKKPGAKAKTVNAKVEKSPSRKVRKRGGSES